jgi:hypothetical protein
MTQDNALGSPPPYCHRYAALKVHRTDHVQGRKVKVTKVGDLGLTPVTKVMKVTKVGDLGSETCGRPRCIVAIRGSTSTKAVTLVTQATPETKTLVTQVTPETKPW